MANNQKKISETRKGTGMHYLHPEALPLEGLRWGSPDPAKIIHVISGLVKSDKGGV